ncbi:MAG: hypothetical protein JRH19_24120 [Deltaproteobacteria bacterium]|nr:hypothetical protein [Deltaproteobacteria bacterium]
MDIATDKRGALKDWLRTRLTEGTRPREEWRELWESSWEHLLATPVRELIDREALEELVDRLADPEFASELLRPRAAGGARGIVAELQQAEQPVERLLPLEARERLERAVARPGLVHPDWVRAVFHGEAAEAVLSDALYRALKDFSTLLPRLMVRISPMGRFGLLGGASAIAEKLIDELEKLIEPEIRAFLAESTGRVLERTAEFTISKLDDPTLIEFRSNLIGFMLSKSPGFYLQAVDEELLEELGAIVALSARHVAGMPEAREQLDRWMDRALAQLEGKTLSELLQLEESEARLPIDTLIDALAAATWPLFTAVLAGPRAQAWMDALVDELIDEYETIAG